MRVLRDEQLPFDLSVEFLGHAVHTVASRGWAGIKNGDLLAQMCGHYDVLVTLRDRLGGLSPAARHQVLAGGALGFYGMN